MQLGLAFHTHKEHATYPSVIGRNVASLLTAYLHSMGDKEIWKGHPIANSLASKIPVTMDAYGCPTEEQLFPPPTNIIRRLAPLWEHKIHDWGQILARSLDARR